MKNTKRSTTSTPRRKTKRGKRGAVMKTRYLISAAVIICAIIIGVLASMGPKLGLQTNKIEPEAVAYLKKYNMLQNGEILEAFKAISYYSFSQGAVVTDKRVFVYDHGHIVHAIPLDSISMVIVKNSELGHQEVIIAARQNGVIGIELYHTYVPKLIKLLGVPKSKIQDSTNIIKQKNSSSQNKTSIKA